MVKAPNDIPDPPPRRPRATRSSSENGNGYAPTANREELLGRLTKLQAVHESLQGLMANAVTSRKEWVKELQDPRRDVYEECGLPLSTEPITAAGCRLL